MKILPVSKFIQYINEAISTFSNAKVEGEVSDFRITRNKWVGFDLKDEEDEQILPCFTTYSLFKSMGMDDVLEDGMRVHVRGDVKVRKKGNFSMFMKEIDLAGEGTLKKAYEKLKKKLKKEGLFKEERKRPISQFPQNIGIITSSEARAYGDFLKVLEDRMGGINIYHIPVHVQGKNAIPEIVAAFSKFDQLYQDLDLDLIVLTRGGGSLEDLQAFNSEDVARSVFSSEVPVVCGVGHEDDVTLAGLTADLRASTPSNAAELIVRHRRQVLADIDSFVYKMRSNINNILDKKNKIIDRFMNKGIRFVSDKEKELSHLLFAFKHKINRYKKEIEDKKELLDRAGKSFISNIEQKVESNRSKIEQSKKLLKSYSPESILNRGYSIVKKGNSIVSNVEQLQKQDEVSVKMSKGGFKGEVRELLK